MGGERRTYRLEELCEFSGGFSFKSTDYVAKSSDVIEVFRMGYIQRGGGFKEDDSPVFVPRSYSRNLDKYFLRPGDITIAMTDMKDRVAILGNTAWIRDSERFVLNQRVGLIRVRRTDLLEPRFLYLYSNWRPYVEHLRSRANSGVQVNLTSTAIKEANLEIPPLLEQKAIASILGALDDKIELNRRANETLEELARTIFKSWFVDFDPVKAKAEGQKPEGMDAETAALFPSRFVESELGMIPEGWEVSILGNLVEFNYGKPLKAEERRDGSIPVFGANGHIGWHDQRLARGPGIVVGRKGNPGVVTWSATDFYSIDTTFFVTPKDMSLGMIYLLHLLRGLDLSRFSADSAVPGLNRNHAYGSLVCRPSPAIIGAFTSAAEPLSLIVHRKDLESRSLATLRDSLLPKLISGEVRVPDAEKLAEAVP